MNLTTLHELLTKAIYEGHGNKEIALWNIDGLRWQEHINIMTIDRFRYNDKYFYLKGAQKKGRFL